MPEIGISLKGVRRTVTGRMKKGARFVYPCESGELVVPERLVMKRAHKAGFGCLRLRPYLWRLLPHLAPAGTDWGEIPPVLEGDEVLVALLRQRPRLVEILLSSFSASRLRKLATRHARGDVDPRKPGVPDLLVFKKSAEGRPYGFRFVEVKRADEKLPRHQRAEIAFMRRLGLRAGVLRLIDLPQTA